MKKISLISVFFCLFISATPVAFAQIPINIDGQLPPGQQKIIDEIQKEDKARGSQIQNEAEFLSNPQSLQAILPDSFQQKTGLPSFLEKVKDIPVIGGIFSGIFTKIFPRTQLWQAVTIPGKQFSTFESEQKSDNTKLWQTTFGQEGFANFVRPSTVDLQGTTDQEKFKSSVKFIEDSLVPAGIQSQ